MKKKIIIVIAAVVVVIMIVIGIFAIKNSAMSDKEKKATKLYGKEYCRYNGEHPDPIDEGVVFVMKPSYKCELCDNTEASYIDGKLCSECAEELHRCKICGKKVK